MTIGTKHKDYQHRKPVTLPAKYTPGFLDEMDKRTEIYQALRSAHDEIVNDMGGVDALSHVKHTIVERFVFLECILRNWERQIIADPQGSARMLSRWVQAINSLSGLTKIIGIDKVRKAKDLKSYIKERSE
jgi:hypothetical protein